MIIETIMGMALFLCGLSIGMMLQWRFDHPKKPRSIDMEKERIKIQKREHLERRKQENRSGGYNPRPEKVSRPKPTPRAPLGYYGYRPQRETGAWTPSFIDDDGHLVFRTGTPPFKP